MKVIFALRRKLTESCTTIAYIKLVKSDATKLESQILVPPPKHVQASHGVCLAMPTILATPPTLNNPKNRRF